jgi:hypothetical protein
MKSKELFKIITVVKWEYPEKWDTLRKLPIFDFLRIFGNINKRREK